MSDDKKKISDHLRYISLEDAFDWTGDWTAAILHDEFHKKESRAFPQPDYRLRGIQRLIDMRVSWGSNGNIDYLIAQKYMSVLCPYCNDSMKFYGSSGRMYECAKCGAVANPTGSLNFNPPKKNWKAAS